MMSCVLVGGVQEREYPFIMCNLAAPDMVGHTGVYNATVVACEACDVVIGNIFTACQKNGYTLVITADHGIALPPLSLLF
jgi:2,3-bisphosphoglycerate-independent phosphoglycerate mutase